MDKIYYTGLTVADVAKNYREGMPRFCYLCKRSEGETSYGIIQEEKSGKMFYNKPVLELGELRRNLGQGMTAVYLLCPECAFLLGVSDELIYEEGGIA